MPSGKPDFQNKWILTVKLWLTFGQLKKGIENEISATLKCPFFSYFLVAKESNFTFYKAPKHTSHTNMIHFLTSLYLRSWDCFADPKNGTINYS